MKVAILGSNGFVGKSLHQLLNNEFSIVPVTRQTLDLTDFQQVDAWLQTVRPDAIINCATAGGKQALSKQEINYQELQNNIAIFLNFYNSKHTKKFINVGSGAEFEKTNNLENVDELELTKVIPIDSYSYSKNIIARMILSKENFYTLRLFGCFGNLEPDFRLFKKLTTSEQINLVDKYFDYISINDFSYIVKKYLTHEGLDKDINCVYKNKHRLSYIANLFIKHHKLKTKINITEVSNINYTGSSSKLDHLGIFLNGLDLGIQNYYR